MPRGYLCVHYTPTLVGVPPAHSNTSSISGMHSKCASFVAAPRTRCAVSSVFSRVFALFSSSLKNSHTSTSIVVIMDMGYSTCSQRPGGVMGIMRGGLVSLPHSSRAHPLCAPALANEEGQQKKQTLTPLLRLFSLTASSLNLKKSTARSSTHTTSGPKAGERALLKKNKNKNGRRTPLGHPRYGGPGQRRCLRRRASWRPRENPLRSRRQRSGGAVRDGGGGGRLR